MNEFVYCTNVKFFDSLYINNTALHRATFMTSVWQFSDILVIIYLNIHIFMLTHLFIFGC